MKPIVSVVVVGLMLLTARATAQDQQFASLGECRLESGDVIRDCRLGYRTFGTLDADRSNVILFPTWAGGTTEQLAGNVGPGRLIDSTGRYVILVDAFANGVSSSPSNSTTQPRMQFPAITIRDMVRAQHELLTRVLDIHHVRAVMGISMGGMQTFQWIVEYPGFMDRAIAIVGSPRLAPYDLLHWQAEIDAIRNDPAWSGGNYTENPARGSRRELADLILTTPEHYNRTHSREQVAREIAAARSARANDANDTLRQSEAMMMLNVAAPFGDSLERAATVVKARVLVIVGTHDHTVTPGPAVEFARMLKADLLQLEDECGHLYASCGDQQAREAVARFLAR
jgi:homoserine O-acetyltransferase